jgi:L-cystine uptake protein TcyP (sodium:dicarboxylate symporter family)
MFNFVFCQVFFAVLNFVFVQNSSAGTIPSWVSDFRR